MRNFSIPELKSLAVKQGITLVLEVKGRTPYNTDWRSPLSNIEMLRLCETSGADIISIHTSPDFGGSWDWLKQARALTDKPILAKGFHHRPEEVTRAFSLGATYVLTVDRWDGNPRCWHECSTLEALAASKAEHVVWNARSPYTGQWKRNDIQQARAVRPGWLCQASGITDLKQIGNVEAVLIGRSLYD